MNRKRALLLLLVISRVVSMTFLGCKEKEPELGSEDNPIVWSFVPSGEMERVSAGAQDVADLLHEETGYFFDTNVATEYVGVVEAMSSDPPKAHMASLATFAYIMAAERGIADAAIVAVRYGSPTYNGQFIARKDSGISKVSDLEGKVFARSDPLSTSSWIIPMITMKAEGIDPATDLENVLDAGSHDTVVSAVYNGEADAGATYVDARTRLEGDFPDVMDEVIVFQVTTDIPNDGVQFHPSISDEMRSEIVDALMKISKTEEGKEALKVAYQWDELSIHGDEFYDPFRQVLQAAGMKVQELIA